MAFSPEKAKDIIIKLIAQANSERSLGNAGAADLFDDKVDRLLEEYSLSREEINKAISSNSQPTFVNEIGISIITNQFNRVNAKTNLRKFWFEELARVIAEPYYCQVDIDVTNGAVILYGYDLDREIAMFMFTKLAESANDLCEREMKLAKSLVGRKSGFDFTLKRNVIYPTEWMGNDVFIDSFHQGFREALADIYLVHGEVDKDKVERVKAWKNANRLSGLGGYRYHPEVYQAELNQSAKSVGNVCGKNIAKMAKKNPSKQLTLNAKKATQEVDQVFILIDNSGSMVPWGYDEKVNKLDQAKKGAIEYARSAVDKKYQIGVINFESSVELLVRPTNEVDEKFINAINSLQGGGGTNLTDALLLAQRSLKGWKNKKVIMVVTDGMPDDSFTALKVADTLKRSGVQIQAIGTDGARQEFLDKLVSKVGLGQLVSGERLALGMGEMAKNL